MDAETVRSDPFALARALVGAVQEAGRVILAHYAAGVAVESKSDASPVTAADRDAEAVLSAALAALAPDTPVIAEEAAAAGRIPALAEAFTLVDPLDGTREFIARRDEFTVNVGVVIGRRPVAGLVYAPALSRLYLTAGPGQAVEADLAADAAPTSFALLQARPIAARSADPAALVAVASRSHGSADTEAYLARHAIVGRRNAGSSLKFCLIARGDADIYPRLGPTMEWDTAAGHAVLAAAGGRVVTLDGADLLYAKADAGYRNPSFVAGGPGCPL